MSYIVIVTFGVISEAATELPHKTINMEFEEENAFEAMQYFTDSVAYFSQAKKFDSNYWGIGIKASLYRNGERLVRKEIR